MVNFKSAQMPRVTSVPETLSTILLFSYERPKCFVYYTSIFNFKVQYLAFHIFAATYMLLVFFPAVNSECQCGFNKLKILIVLLETWTTDQTVCWKNWYFVMFFYKLRSLTWTFVRLLTKKSEWRCLNDSKCEMQATCKQHWSSFRATSSTNTKINVTQA